MPGQLCTPCAVKAQKEYRARKRNGESTGRPTFGPMPRFARALASERYVITSAQNATPVEEEAFAALKVAAKHLRAELIVVPFRYKNPTSTFKDEPFDWWDESLSPYLYNQRKHLHKNLVLAADVKIQPTAGDPLAGFEALTGSQSCILGHPKMQMRCVPSPISGKYPKILHTTGTITKQNYTDSKAGKLGAFHHYLGAILVETEGKWFGIRELNVDRKTGEFIDLDKVYSPRGVKKAPPALGLVMGDRHERFVDPKVDTATFGEGGMVDVLNPEQLVWEDTFDGYSVNHHHWGNPFLAHAKGEAGFSNPEEEVRFTVEAIKRRTKGRKSVIVASNHDDFLSRWLNSADWKSVGAKRFYLETALAMLDEAKMTPNGFSGGDPFVYWVNELKGNADIHCLREGENYEIAGIDVSFHGHSGPRGAKGTMKNFARVGARLITGHAHEPGIEEGHYRVGTSTPLQLEYNRGPGSWLNCHCVIYANGKRSLLPIIEGKWRKQ